MTDSYRPSNAPAGSRDRDPQNERPGRGRKRNKKKPQNSNGRGQQNGRNGVGQPNLQVRGAAGSDHYRPSLEDRISHDGPRHRHDQYRPNGQAHDFGGQDNGFQFTFRSNQQQTFAPLDPYDAHANRRRQTDARKHNQPRAARPIFSADRRALMRTKRETTPERLAGMITGPAKFRNVDELSESEASMELDSDDSSAGKSDEQPSKKRVKLEEEAPPKPKWSNPDPYTSLPPPDESSQGKRKDVVQLIRKAKIAVEPEQAAGNEVSQNADFIPLSFGDDEDQEMHASPPPPPPPQPQPFVHGLPPKPPPPTAPANAGSLSIQLKNTQDRFQDSRKDLRRHLRDFADEDDDEEYEPPLPDNWPVQHDGPTQPAFPGRDIKAATGARRGKQKALPPDAAPLHLGKKRKMPAADAAVLPEWWVPAGQTGTPWCTSATDHSSVDNMMEWLRLEMIDFHEHVKPCAFEQSLREDLVSRLRKHVQKYGGMPCDVKCFGSYAQGTYLPTGDMDLVVVSRTFEMTGNRGFAMTNYKKMFMFLRTLMNSGLASRQNHQIIAKARVPIIKYIDAYTGLNVDISFENLSGVVAIRTYQDWAAEFPCLNIFVAIVKQFLKMRGLNEVVDGGIGGFSVSCLVYIHLKLNPKILSGEIEPENRLGELLLDFLDFYGSRFNVASTAIQMRPPRFIPKNQVHIGNAAKAKQDRLTIIDPNNATNDISGGSSRISAIFAAFRAARTRLMDRMDELKSMSPEERKGQSILGVILAGNYKPFDTQRAHLEKLWERRGRH